MAEISELQRHLLGIEHHSPEVDVSFLEQLGNELLRSDGEDLDLAYMQYVKEILNKLYIKYFSDDSAVDEGVEKAWLKARGMAMALSKGELPPADFYSEALILGRKIKKLAHSIGLLAWPVLFLSELLPIK